jgi:hypothetical protein
MQKRNFGSIFKKTLAVSISALTMTYGHQAYGQNDPLTTNNTNTTSTKLKVVTKDPVPSSFSFEGSLEYTTLTDKVANPNSLNPGLQMILAPKYKFTNRLSLSSFSIVNQDFEGTQNTTLLNTRISLGIVNFKNPTSGIGMSTEIFGVAPTHRDGRDASTFLGGYGLSESLTLPIVKKGIPTTFVLLGRVQKNEYKNMLAVDGTPNTEYQLKIYPELDISFTEKLDLAISGIYFMDKATVFDGYYNYHYYSDIAFAYKVTKALQLTFGICNEESSTKDNGTDPNMNFYNQSSAKLHTGIAWSL